VPGRACMSQRYLLALSRATEPTLTGWRREHVPSMCSRNPCNRCVCSECRRIGVTVNGVPRECQCVRRQATRRVWLFYGSFLREFSPSCHDCLSLHTATMLVKVVTFQDPELYPPASCSLPVRPGCPNQGRPDARRCTPPRQCAATAPDRFHWKVRLHTRSSPVRFGAPIPIQCARATQLVLGALPVPKLLAHVPDEGGNQRRPEAIRGDQRRSDAIRGGQRPNPLHAPFPSTVHGRGHGVVKGGH
jgi:hypothetical protein